MARYLLTCACGQSVPVEIGQAGGQARCQCGALVDVPPLRRLRHLPVEQSAQAAATAKWQPKYGIVAAFAVLALILGGVCLAVRLSEPTVEPIDMQGMHVRILNQIDEMSPTQWYTMWNYDYRPSLEQGFPVYETRLTPQGHQEIAKKRLIEKSLLIVAALCAAAATAVAAWPTSQPRKSPTRRS